jgi:hypothetical protein
MRCPVALPGGARLELQKRILLEQGQRGFHLQYRLSVAAGTARALFATELLVNLLAGHAHDRSVWVDGRLATAPTLDGLGSHPGAQVVSLLDGPERMRISVHAPGAHGFVRAPLWTVSLSEAGAERIFQGTLLLPYWRIDLAAGAQAQLAVRFTIQGTSGHEDTR